MTFPEEVDGYSIYGPADTGAGWTISCDGLWLPVICADRDACQAIMDLEAHPDWWEIIGELEQLMKTTSGLSAGDIRQHLENRESRKVQQ